MAQKYIGVCTECGGKGEVTLVDEVTSLCDDCLDELDYIECDQCKEYWCWDKAFELFECFKNISSLLEKNE